MLTQNKTGLKMQKTAQKPTSLVWVKKESVGANYQIGNGESTVSDILRLIFATRFPSPILTLLACRSFNNNSRTFTLQFLKSKLSFKKKNSYSFENVPSEEGNRFSEKRPERRVHLLRLKITLRKEKEKNKVRGERRD